VPVAGGEQPLEPLLGGAFPFLASHTGNLAEV
jgi:hypothetical protein